MPIRSGDKKARRALAPTHRMYLDPSLPSSYSAKRQKDRKTRRGLDPTHPLYLDPMLRSSYTKERSYNNFMAARALRRAEVFRDRRDSFINANTLPLNPAYNSELASPHWYPGKVGTKQVLYLRPEHRDRTTKRLQNGMVSDTNLFALSRGKKISGRNRNVIFTRRGSVDDLMMMQKHEVSQGDHKPRVKTNHSSFNRGRAVANAGFLKFDDLGKLTEVKLSSGHYKPGHDSGVALAMWADQTGAFDPSTVPIVDKDRNAIDVSRGRRISVVNRWAALNPKV